MKPIRSLYIHFPYCTSLCTYCDFFRQKSSGSFEDYFSYLDKSTQLHLELSEKYQTIFSPLETFYLGGGTPGLLERGDLERLFSYIERLGFSFQENAEKTIEMNPLDGETFEKKIDLFEELGLNRVSIGVQSLDDATLKAFNRQHTVSDVLDSLSVLKGRMNFSLDFMLGLPKRESKRDLIHELEKVLSFGPSHLSLYILNPPKFFKESDLIPCEEDVAAEYLMVSEYLKSHGFHHYEVSNFCKPNFHSKHNVRYWDSESVWALGPTASGAFFSEDVTYRFKWMGYPHNPKIDFEILNIEQRKLEKLYLLMRTDRGIFPSDFGKGDEVLTLCNNWEGKGLGSFQNGRFILNSRGFLLQDSLMNELFQKIPIL